MTETIDPILTTPTMTVIWNLTDGSPMPPEGTRFKVLRETYAERDDGTEIRTIEQIKLVD